MIEDSKRAQPRFHGMTDAIKKIVAEEGVGGLYRGLGPVVSAELRRGVGPQGALLRCRRLTVVAVTLRRLHPPLVTCHLPCDF